MKLYENPLLRVKKLSVRVRMPTVDRTWITDILVLALCISIVYSIFLGVRPLAPPDEGRYSEIPREMVISGNYTTPHLNGVKYFEKPALFYWLQSLSIKMFGLKEWSLRLITMCMGVLGCILTYWSTRKLFNRRTGILSAIILSSSLLYAGLAHFITLDMTLTLFLTGCLLFFLIGNQYPPGKTRNYYLWGMYIFAGLATLTKGLIGIIFPGMIIFFWICACQQWRQLSNYCLLSGSLIFLAITIPWHIAVQLQNPEFFHFYFVEQHFLRYLTDYASRGQPVWFLPTVLIVGFFPWTGFLLVALTKNLHAFKNWRIYTREIFLIIWAAVVFLFYWVSHSQLAPYVLPVFPPLAIIVARYLDSHWDVHTKGLQLGFFSAFAMSVCFNLGILFLIWHDDIHSMSAPLALLVLSFLCICLLVAFLRYQYKTVQVGIKPLLLGMGIFIILINLCSDLFETRSVKPLASQLLQIINQNDHIYTYNDYYQDLPFYLKRKVTIVSWVGELKFGSKHQDMSTIFATDAQFWKDWNSSNRVFMVLELNDYKSLIRNQIKRLHPIAKTKRSILLSNQEVKQ